MGSRHPAHEAGRGRVCQAASQNDASGLPTAETEKENPARAAVTEAGYISGPLGNIDDAATADPTELVYADRSREWSMLPGQDLAALSLHHATWTWYLENSSSRVTHTHTGE